MYRRGFFALLLAAGIAGCQPDQAPPAAPPPPKVEFVEAWVTAEPPEHLPYYGSWGDDNGLIHATAWSTHGPARVSGAMAELPPIYLPDPKDLALLGQQTQIAELQARLAELEPGETATSEGSRR